MKLLYVALLTFLLTGCNRRVSTKSDNCRKYIKQVKRSWPVEIDGYFNLVDFDKVFTKEKDCFIGKSKEDIIALFGEPSEQQRKYYHYYLKKECTRNKANRGGCVTLSFGFSAQTDKVIMVQEPFTWPDNIQ